MDQKVGNIFWMLVLDANVKRKWMLVSHLWTIGYGNQETVTNILLLSLTHFVANIDVTKMMKMAFKLTLCEEWSFEIFST